MSPTHAADITGVLAAMGSRLDARPFVILLDVDGTLAPIAPRPEAAMVPDDTRAAVRRLTRAAGVHVALVSGRGALDAARLVGVEGVWALGNHGMELLAPDGSLEPDPAVLPFEPDVAEAARALAALAANTPGALLENKRWTLSLHYRLVDETLVPELRRSAGEVARAGSLRVTEGKKVIEVRPRVAIDKGTASVALATRLGAFAPGGAALFAGDDRTDEDAIRALRAHSTAAITIRVGTDGGDTDAEFRVSSPETFRELLAGIAARRRDP